MNEGPRVSQQINIRHAPQTTLSSSVFSLGEEFFSRRVLWAESQAGQRSANTQTYRVLEGSAEPGGVEKNVGKQPGTSMGQRQL